MSAVDLDLLADYVGGALEGTPEQDRVAALVATDPAWQAAADELHAALPLVDTGLAALAAQPEPMPDDIAARFDALLASPEFAPVPAVPPRAGVGERTLSRDGREARPARRGLRRWAAPVAVAAGVLALAGIVLPLGPFGSADQEAGLTSIADAPAPAVAPADGSVSVTTSEQNYLRRDLMQNRALSSAEANTLSSPQAKASDTHTYSSKSGLSELAAPEALSRCLDAVRAALPGTITAVELARFEGLPAAIVTVDTPGGGWLFVAGPQCGVDGADELFRAPRN